VSSSSSAKRPRALAPILTRIVVAIDPSVTSGREAAETGIVVAGVDGQGYGYVLEDLSCRGSPDQWASRAVLAYHKHRADRILGEVNNGGEMIEHVLRTVDPSVAYRAVHASRGKVARAEPVAALYEQGRVHHVGGFPELEEQCCVYSPGGPSPDRMDALVWALTDLMVGQFTVDEDTLAEAIRIANEMFGKGRS
jgi:phage terminase large subunit-like protein